MPCGSRCRARSCVVRPVLQCTHVYTTVSACCPELTILYKQQNLTLKQPSVFGCASPMDRRTSKCRCRRPANMQRTIRKSQALALPLRVLWSGYVSLWCGTATVVRQSYRAEALKDQLRVVCAAAEGGTARLADWVVCLMLTRGRDVECRCRREPAKPCAKQASSQAVTSHDHTRHAATTSMQAVSSI